MAITLGRTLGGMRKTRATPEALASHFVGELRKWVDKEHGGNQTKAGNALGFTQGHISAVLSFKRGPGLELIAALREATTRSMDDLLGLPGAEDERVRKAVRAALEALREEEKQKQRPPSSPPPLSRPDLLSRRRKTQ